MFKRVVSLMLVIALTAAIAISGTMAYLTQDVGNKENVFSVGDIDITLTEEVAVIGKGGEVTETKEGAEYSKIMPGDYLKKEVTIANEGEMPAYVAVTVTLKNDNHDFANLMNLAIDERYGDDKAQDLYDFIFDGWGLNHGKDLDGDNVNDTAMRLTITGTDMPEHVLQVDSVKTIDEYALFHTGNWFGEQEDVIPFDGYYTADMDAYELRYVYYMLLPAGESTTLFNGLNVPAKFDKDQLAMFKDLTIEIEAEAIQADNMGVLAIYANDPDGEAKTAFSVLNNPDLADELDVDNSTEDALFANVLENGGTIALTEDKAADGFTVGADAAVVIDLGGNAVNTNAGFVNNGTATISNGTLNDNSTSGYGTRTPIGGETTYNDVDVVTKAGGVNVWGTAVWNGGSVTNNSASTSARHVFYVAGAEGATGHLTINGGEFTFSPTNLTRKGSYICAEGADATVIVNGGTFHKPSTRTAPIQALSGATVTIYGGTFRFDPSAFVAAGYQAVKGTDGYWTVSAI